jgi:Zn-dependent M28 family amino/carboxypeptidase
LIATRFVLTFALLALFSCAPRVPPVVSAPAAAQLFASAVTEVASLEVASNEARFDVITKMLTQRNIAYEVEPFTIKPRKTDPRTDGRNIVITFPGREPEIVVGGHYDAVRMADGTLSQGAVDNAASVVVLLRVAEALTRSRPRSRVRIVLFDMEELGLLGSEHYAQIHRERQTRAMVNLDVNAFGDTTIFGPRAASNEAAFQALRQTCREVARRCMEFARMPPSDDLSFQKAGIPTVSIATVPELQAHQLWLLMNGGKESGLQPKFTPDVLRTIHTASDSSALVEPAAMAQAYRVVLSLISLLDD